MSSLLHKKISDSVLKTYYEVYNNLGYGFLEKVYQNAIFFELQSQGLKVEAQNKLKFIIKIKLWENILQIF